MAKINCHPIDIGYYINDNDNDFAYYNANEQQVYIFDKKTESYEIIPCFIFEFKFVGSIYMTFPKNQNLIIICPERLKAHITFYSFSYCFANFMDQNKCECPVFTSLSFIYELEIILRTIDLPNFWRIRNQDFYYLKACFDCPNCSIDNRNINSFKNCTKCSFFKYFLPLFVFAGAVKTCSIEDQTLFDKTCLYFLQSLFIIWSSEIKSVVPVGIWNLLGLLEYQPNNFYRMVLYLLHPNLKLDTIPAKFQPKYVFDDIFKLLKFLSYDKHYHFIFPALLYAYGPSTVFNKFSIGILNPKFKCDIEPMAKIDIEKILNLSISRSSFKHNFSDNYVNSTDIIGKAADYLEPYIQKLDIFSANYCDVFADFLPNEAGKYIHSITNMIQKLKELHDYLVQIKKNFKKYSKQDISDYAKALKPFVENVPDRTKWKTMKHAVLFDLTKIYFQTNIADYYQKEVSISASIEIFINNYINYNYPDINFLRYLKNSPYFNDAYLHFIVERDNESNQQSKGDFSKSKMTVKQNPPEDETEINPLTEEAIQSQQEIKKEETIQQKPPKKKRGFFSSLFGKD